MNEDIKTALVIPFIDNLDLVNHNKDRLLCFNLNRLYVQSTDLQTILAVLLAFQVHRVISLIGDVEKVKVGDTIYYRQRLYTTNFGELIKLCKQYTIEVDVDKSFYITLNSLHDCFETLPYLYKYARLSCLTIDTWLKYCFIMQLHTYLATIKFKTNINPKMINVIVGRIAFLNRSPFLKLNDNTYFSVIPDEGYTIKSVKKDKKEGIFNEY